MARNLNENNLAGVENPDLYNYEAELILLASSECMLKFIRETSKSCICLFQFKFTRSKEIYQFTERCLSLNDEALKINNDKKLGEKAPCLLNHVYRCHHAIRYKKTRVSSLHSQKRNKRYKHNHCPFNLC